MPAGLRHAARVAAAVFFVALALPAAALAGGGGNSGKCNASACKVYHEQDLPNAGGQQQPPQQPQQPSSGGSKTGGSKTGGGGHTHVPPKVTRVLQHAGPDKGPLAHLLTDTGPSGLKTAGSVAAPSALGAAFDLGAGPTVLLAILVATAVGLAATGSLRNWRRRRPSA
jgi:hypothetical protein